MLNIIEIIKLKWNSFYLLILEKILNPNWYVRDLYFFKRSQYPQLRLVEMPTQEAFNALQQQELVKKFVEIGKVHLTWAILKNVDMVINQCSFANFKVKPNRFFLLIHLGGATSCIFARGIDEIAVLSAKSSGIGFGSVPRR